METKETKHEVRREKEAVTFVCPVKSTFDKNGTSDLAVTWSHEGRPLNESTQNIEVNTTE